MSDSDGDRLFLLILDHIGRGQAVQVHNKAPRSGIGNILRLLHKVKVQLIDEPVGQLGGHRAVLGADDQLSGFILAGEDDVGEIDLHAAGRQIDRV